MNPKCQRRVHGAEFKSTVLAECVQPGASVAAVALAHGLNVNLVRKWLVGRGMKRSGIQAPRASASLQPAQASPSAQLLQFVPVGVVPQIPDAPVEQTCDGRDIRIELRRGDVLLNVCWPASQAAECGAWLREFAAGGRK